MTLVFLGIFVHRGHKFEQRAAVWMPNAFTLERVSGAEASLRFWASRDLGGPMVIVFVILGGILGAFLADGSDEFLGFGLGAGLGFLLNRLRRLENINESLRRDLDRLLSGAVQTKPASRESVPPADREVPLPEAAQLEAATESVTIPRPAEPEFIASAPTRAPDQTAAAKFVQKLFGLAKAWLTTGNVPVKLGVIVTFFGVAFLLKYAVDRQVLVIPIEYRLLAVALAAIGLLVFGWKLRNKSAVYALSVQGGAIGILYLTIFAGMRLYGLIPAPFAFALLVGLTVFAGVLAVLQDSRALAVLGAAGGFLAPVLVSTGGGSHVALFSYYLVINAAIVAISWFKSWRVLNLVGFFFTASIAGLWGSRSYDPSLFASTEPFLIIFFVFYQMIALAFSYRQPPKLRGVVDGTLVFGVPVVAFGFQAAMLNDSQFGLAISAIVLALFFVGCASWIFRRHEAALRTLTESYLAMAVAFATLSLPLALDPRWTAAAWALEAAALVWIGVRQRNWLAKITGIALAFFSGGSFFADDLVFTAGRFLLNGDFVGAVLIGLSGIFAAWQLDKVDTKAARWQRVVAMVLLLWGLCWWMAAAFFEIFERVPDDGILEFLTAHLAITGLLWAFALHRLDWQRARWFSFGFILFPGVYALLNVFQNEFFLSGWLGIGWVAVWAAQFAQLKVLPANNRLSDAWHGLTLIALTVFLVSEWLIRAGDLELGETWALSVSVVLMGVMAMAVLRLDRVFTWPIAAHWRGWLGGAIVVVVAQLGLAILMGLNSYGLPGPLSYIPLLNPYDLASIYAIAAATRLYLRVKQTTDWLNERSGRIVLALLGAAAFIITTCMVLRGVHHVFDLRWRGQVFSGSGLVQTALSVYWGLLGMAGMLLGTRWKSRWLWIAGTALMVIVIAKLALIDLSNKETIAGVVSFIGVGVLLLVAGYFAPAPPKNPKPDVGKSALTEEAKA